MKITVTGKQMDVGESLQSHAHNHLADVSEKYFQQAIEGNVVFEPEAHHKISCHISVHASAGVMVRGESVGDDAYKAFDAALQKISERLRRYKDRFRKHQQREKNEQQEMFANKYILADQFSDDHEVSDEDLAPAIVAEMDMSIDTLTVSEAVMRMDLADLPAMMFRNSAHGGLNLVYRRPDGNIGWVDPRGQSQSGAQGSTKKESAA